MSVGGRLTGPFTVHCILSLPRLCHLHSSALRVSFVASTDTMTLLSLRLRACVSVIYSQLWCWVAVLAGICITRRASRYGTQTINSPMRCTKQPQANHSSAQTDQHTHSAPLRPPLPPHCPTALCSSFAPSIRCHCCFAQPPIDVKATVASPAARDVLPLETVDADKLMSANQSHSLIQHNNALPHSLHSLCCYTSAITYMSMIQSADEG